MPSKLRCAPLASGNVDIQISGPDLLVPGLITGVSGDFANIGDARNKTFADEAVQIALQEQKIPFIGNRSRPITVRARLV